ncbi:cytochrome c [Nitrospirillum iridis]|uniref:Nicotinate dehydrogenase subunit B n=1 Tax=Nitrospirillum iridis TaxID=765888 RepID=A0A7X0AXR2_9PROT|nr:cytochrome c [Nitrospirillum iridis]MBB6252064.1 nicotinate dehydrogenase subunit B [Nitrospirillum iridis]
MRRKHWVGAAAACIALGGLAALAVAYRAPLPAIARPDAASFDRARVARGAVLAAIGDCAVCHTADRGAAYAGGRPLPTPFGTLYTTNITPDIATGIGTWSLDAFTRALREGVARDGHHLYPALPYEHYTHVTDGDVEALYAFLMTRPAVSAPPQPNHMIFPLGFRPLLAGWKLLFLHRGALPPRTDRDAQWNRGAYLVEGLGHCGGCHTPRNPLGGEETGRAYAGGVAEGWVAPPLDGSSPAPIPWTADGLYRYLRTGMDGEHGAAAGPMGPVTHDLSAIPEDEVRAIAVYVASLRMDGRPGPGPGPVDHADAAAQAHPAGAALFAGACGGCHEAGAPMLTGGRPGLGLASGLQLEEPANVVRAILEGLRPPVGAAGPFMPPFANSLTDGQVAEVAAYLRARYSDRPAWTNLTRESATARKEGQQP